MPPFMRGPIEWIHDCRGCKVLEEMVAVFERGAEVPWKMDNVPADYTQRMLGGSWGFRCRLKLSKANSLNQRSTDEDRSGIVAELNKLGTDSAKRALQLQELLRSDR
jgi:predicted FMN-binding regulatory protein PaiB